MPQKACSKKPHCFTKGRDLFPHLFSRLWLHFLLVPPVWRTIFSLDSFQSRSQLGAVSKENQRTCCLDFSFFPTVFLLPISDFSKKEMTSRRWQLSTVRCSWLTWLSTPSTMRVLLRSGWRVSGELLKRQRVISGCGVPSVAKASTRTREKSTNKSFLQQCKSRSN